MVITPQNVEPAAKNPIIASFFRTIGFADQLGSGVRNLFKYSRPYGGGDPEFLEGDIFRITVPLDKTLMEAYVKGETGQNSGAANQDQNNNVQGAEIAAQGQNNNGQDVRITVQADNSVQGQNNADPDTTPAEIQARKRGRKQSEASIANEAAVLEFFSIHPASRQKEAVETLHLSARAVKYYIARLKKQGRLVRQGTSQKGTWVVKDIKNSGT